MLGSGHALAVRDPLGESDAIVALSGDAGERARTAIELWRQRHAPLLIFSGGSQDPTSIPSAEIMKREALRAGVPEDSVLVEPSSATTAENAARVADLMAARGLRTAILVTSPYHQRRAAFHFTRAFAGSALSFRNHPADDPGWDPTLWWLHEASRQLTLVELAKLAVEVFGAQLPLVATAGILTASMLTRAGDRHRRGSMGRRGQRQDH
ncbi:MAG: YdcF family protein [Candidatus Limnocylindria bacterium]